MTMKRPRVAAREPVCFENPHRPMTTTIYTAEKPAGTNTTTTTEPDLSELITGPFVEPIEQGGASYWKCADCGRESIRRIDLEHPAFHASGCAGAE